MKTTKTNKTILVGKVKTIEPKSNDCVIINVSHIEWDKAKKQNVTIVTRVPFWNNSRVQWADILNKFNVKEGTAVGVKYNTTDDGKIFGSDFCFYSGKLVVNSESNGQKQETNVIIGRVGAVKELTTISTATGDKTVKTIDVAESKRDKSGTDTAVWHNISFWDGEKNDFATRADKVIKKGDLIAVVCGECKQNGEYLNYTGFNFDILGRPKKKSETPQTTEDGAETEASTETVADYSVDYDDEDDEDYPF